MRYLITGHTGFKGSWLTMWLTSAGHEVCGLSLDPEPNSLFELAHVGELCTVDIRGDIRSSETVSSALRATAPDVVIHLAAQPLVRESYRYPRLTMETNVLGTLNVLEANAHQPSVKAAVIVTTDKVYRNLNQFDGYIESDALGGEDPYSASKAMADILTHSWAVSFPGPRTGIARAGNVIGGGDVSDERLLPDIIRALRVGEPPLLRYPNAVRPWQHVLDCISGYMMLTEALLEEDSGVAAGESWNFGPEADSFVSVGELASLALEYWGSTSSWSPAPAGIALPEADLLALSSEKSNRRLGWRNRLGFSTALRWTIDWYRDVDRGTEPRLVVLDQISSYRELSPNLVL